MNTLREEGGAMGRVSRQRTGLLLAVTFALFAVAGIGGPAFASRPGGSPATAPVNVIVQAGSVGEAAAAVEASGHEVAGVLPVIGAVVASVSADAADSLAASGLRVSPNAAVTVASASYGGEPATGQVEALGVAGDRAVAGEGVTVALIDTGVAGVPELDGRVLEAVDLTDEADGIDRYGHGTFMAGLIVGEATGAAPAAGLVSVKVAGADGSTSLGEVIEGIGWVVDHREELGIRVLSLSLGVDMGSGFAADPLGAAVEAAWASGIAVVVAAGNEGDGVVTSPGRDPWVITVGATDHAGTAAIDDDSVPDWSGAGRVGPVSKPELLAPGVSVVSLRAPGSTVDAEHPDARVGDRWFKGTGTSMSAALVSGSVAVLASRHPEATPDDLKTAMQVGGHAVAGEIGAIVDVAAADAVDEAGLDSWWHGQLGNGHGNDAAEGWTGTRWGGTRWSGTRWSGTRWSGTRWSGTRWSDEDWAGTRWSGTRWTGTRWTGTRWTGTRWTGTRWTGTRWTGTRWTGTTWTARFDNSGP